MKAIARNQFLHSLSVAYPLSNMKNKQQRDSYRTGENVYNYIPDKPSKFTPSTQEELWELADDFSSHSLKKWAIVTHTNGQQAHERPQRGTPSLQRQQILYREGVRYKDNSRYGQQRGQSSKTKEIKIEWSFDLSPSTRPTSKGNAVAVKETPALPQLLTLHNKPRSGENQSAHNWGVDKENVIFVI